MSSDIWAKDFVIKNNDAILHLALRKRNIELDRTLRAVYIELESSESKLSRTFPRLDKPASQSLHIPLPTHGSFCCIVTSADDISDVQIVQHGEHAANLLMLSCLFEHNGLTIFAALYVEIGLLHPQTNYLVECFTSDEEWEEVVSALSGDSEPNAREAVLKTYLKMDNSPLTMENTFFTTAVPGHVYLTTTISLRKFLEESNFERSDVGILESDEDMLHEKIERRRRLNANRVREDVIEHVPMGPGTSMIRWSVTCAKCESDSNSFFGLSQLAQHYALTHDNSRLKTPKYRAAFASALLRHHCDVAVEESERMVKKKKSNFKD